MCTDAMQRVGGAGSPNVEEKAHMFTRFQDKVVRFPINEDRPVKGCESRCITH